VVRTLGASQKHRSGAERPRVGSTSHRRIHELGNEHARGSDRNRRYSPVSGGVREHASRLMAWLTSSDIRGETEGDRARERNQRAVASAIAGLALRGSSFAVVLVTVPLTLGLLGPTRFGMWMTLAALITLLGVTDLGVGNGVLNNVAHAFGRGDQAAARQYLASGIAALTIVALLLAGAFFLAYPFVSWQRVYNVGSDPVATAEAGPATAVFVATFLVGLPLGLAAQARAALQESFIQSGFHAMGNVFTLCFLALAIVSRAPLPILVLAIAGGPLLAAATNFIVLVKWQRPWLRPRHNDVTVLAFRSVTGVGLAFLILQIAYTIAFTSDRIVIAQVIGPDAVADYAVVYRLFAIPAGLASIAVLPLWPAYREAITRSDLGWVRSTLRRSLILVLLGTIPLALLLALLGPTLVAIWTQDALSPPPSLYWGLALFTVCLGVANVFSVLLNGAQAMRFLIPVWIVTALVSIATSIYLASRVGVAGVALGSVVALTLGFMLPCIVFVPRLLKRLEVAARSRRNALGGAVEVNLAGEML
jgi:O-antigen/teichoic acid export membrane protein